MDSNARPGFAAQIDLWNKLITLTGLITYYYFFRDSKALNAAKSLANLIVNTFGPGKQDKIQVMHNRGKGGLVSLRQSG